MAEETDDGMSDEIPRHHSRYEMLRWLEAYEELLRQYKTARDLGGQPSEAAQLKEQVEKELAEISKFQAKGNLSYFTLSKLDNVSTKGLKRNLRLFERWLGKIPTDLDMTEYEKPFQWWRKLLDEGCIGIKDALEERGDTPSPATQAAARVASQVQAYIETVRLLEERCEEDVKSHPKQEAEIRRRYRRAIDALKDTA